MSNKPHVRITNKRAGLVEVYVTEDHKVALQLFPPGREPVVLGLSADEARGLAGGLLEGAEEAERGADA